MTAETIGKALDGRKIGGGWVARCPAHDDRKPSLSIATGKDGKAIEVRGCDIFTFRDGKIAVKNSFRKTRTSG